MLTLQLLRVMDQLWISEKIDMRMKPYQVCASTHVLRVYTSIYL